MKQEEIKALEHQIGTLYTRCNKYVGMTQDVAQEFAEFSAPHRSLFGKSIVAHTHASVFRRAREETLKAVTSDTMLHDRLQLLFDGNFFGAALHRSSADSVYIEYERAAWFQVAEIFGLHVHGVQAKNVYSSLPLEYRPDVLHEDAH